MSKQTALILFAVSAAFALAIHYLAFEMRYMWYVTHEDARFMRIIYICCVGIIGLLWVFFPSRIAVAAVGTFGLLFPHLFFASEARPLLGRLVDLESIVVLMVAVGLLVLATHLRLQGTAITNAP